MRTEIAIISALALILSVPLAFAQVDPPVEENIFSFMQVLPDGTILDENGNEIIYEKNWFVTEDDNTIQVQLENNKLVFDKNSSAVTIFDGNTIAIKSDSYVVRGAPLNTDNWTNLNVNDFPVTYTVSQQEYNVIITFTKENNEGKFDVETIIGNEHSKTTAKFTNYIYEDYKFAFTETLELPDNIIKLNSQDIDLSLYAGQSFPRAVLEENMDLFLEAKQVYFNAGLGFEYLWQVNIHENNTVSLDWANVGQTHTPIGETVELDPTYSFTIGGSYGSSNSQFKYPQGVTTDSNGNILVADQSNHRVQVFNSSGTYQFTIGTGVSGSSNSQFYYPRGVATDSNNRIIVADTNNHRVQVFDSNGTYQFTIGTTGSWGSSNSQFYYPYGVATDSNDNILVADGNNHRIQVFDSSGTYQFTIGTGVSGSSNSQFKYPQGVTTDSNGNILVADTYNHRIQVFNSSGTYQFTIGTGVSGSSNSQFYYPFGVTTDSNGRIIIGDQSNHRVQVFDSNGTYQFTIGTGVSGSSNSQFYYPYGVATDSNDNILVADGSNHRVQVFTTVTAPTSPTNLTTTQNTANQIQLNWTAPSSGSAPSSYEIYANSVLVDTIGNATTYTDNITGAEIGASLTYMVEAINSAGSATSNNSIITSWDVPDAPTGFQTQSGIPISLSWVTPLSDDTITNYKIYRDGSLIDTIGAVNSYSDSNIVAGTPYAYQISAVSAVGESATSSSSNATAGTPPDAPTNLTSVINNPNPNPLTISLDWDAPTNFGTAGSISGYEIIRNGSSVATIGTTSQYDDTVPNSGTFVYEVKATSAHGSSVASNSSSITTATVPDAITDLSATATSDTQVDLTWSQPGSGGSNIVEYKIIRDGIQIATTPTPNYSDNTAVTQTSYTYEIITNNNVGDSANSNQSTVLTFGVPDAPVVTATTYDNDRIDITWSTPNGYGNAVTDYSINVESPTGNGFSILVANTGLVNTYTHSGLNGITEYNYEVTATNLYGVSPGGTDSAITLSDAPTGLIVTPSSSTSQLTLTWNPPANAGVTGYTIERENGIGNGWNVIASNHNGVSYLDTGLSVNTYYNYRVSSETPIGVSPPGNTYSMTTFNLPDPVTTLTASSTVAGVVDLSWSPPSTPYGIVIGYTVYSVDTPGTGATATATLSTTLDQISAITIVNSGSMYTTAPTVTISSPDGVAPFVNATATATILNGSVTAITITNPGNGYNTVPTVTLSAPNINTTVVASTTLDPIVEDTLTGNTSYTVNVDPTSTHSFAVAPITIHGSTILGGAIDSVHPNMIFDGTLIDIPNETNPEQVPIMFTSTRTGNDTNLLLEYDSSLDVNCETTSPFNNITTTFPNLSETPVGNGKVVHTMTFQNSDNTIIDMMCYDNNNPDITGQYRISQSIIPLKTQVDDFSDNVFNTGSTFAALDLMTLLVVIVSMIGFNRKNPAVGLGIMGGVLGLMSVLQIIQWQTTAVGGIILVVFLAIIMGRRRRS